MNKIYYITCFCILFFLKSSYSYEIKQITNNTYNDWRPQVTGSYITWYGTAATNNTDEIFRYDIEADDIKRITDNSTHDRYSQVSSTGNVTWEAYHSIASQYMDVYFYNATTDTSHALVSNTVPDRSPQIDGDNVVWYGTTIAYQIFYFDGTSTSQLTDRPYEHSFFPQIEGDTVVWSGYDPNLSYKEQIYYTNLSNPTAISQITASSSDNFREPQLSGTGIAYIGASGMADTDEIYYYDILTDNIIQVTDNDYCDKEVRVDNGYITWHGAIDGSTWQVYLYDTNTGVTIQLSDNDTGGYYPDIEDGKVAWAGMDGNIYVYFIETGETIQLTDTTYNEANPEISGNIITWEGHIDDWEIFMTVLPEVEQIPEPLSIFILCTLLILKRVTTRTKR